MSDFSDVRCPRCKGGLLFRELENRVVTDETTGRITSTLFREVSCQECDYTGEYVPWRETSQGNASTHTPLPLMQPPPRSNTALILDAQRMVLASEPLLGAAVFRAQSFEHAEYIVWCTGSVLKRVRTAQRELIKAEGEHARESYRYHHVWDGIEWSEFWFSPGWIERENTLDTVDTR